MTLTIQKSQVHWYHAVVHWYHAVVSLQITHVHSSPAGAGQIGLS